MELPNVTGVEAVILDLLASGAELYGYEMAKASSRLRSGAIYVHLHRMEDKGFVESRTEPRRDGARGRPRRLYRITGLGQELLEARRRVAALLSGELAPAGGSV